MKRINFTDSELVLLRQVLEAYRDSLRPAISPEARQWFDITSQLLEKIR